MTITVNGAGRSYAQSLISAGKVNKTADWSFSADDGNALLGADGDDWTSYGKAHLGLNSEGSPNTKGRYEYPFEKGGTLYRSALTAIRQRASQNNATSVYTTAGDLLAEIDKNDKSATPELPRGALPDYDPDGDGDNDAEEAIGHIADAADSLADAIECLTGTDADQENEGEAEPASATAKARRTIQALRAKLPARARVLTSREFRAGAGRGSEIVPFPVQPREGRELNYRMAARPGGTAEIFLYDVIGYWLGGISAEQFATDLKGLGNVSQIDLRINSPGGDVMDGRAIYTQLAQHPAKVVAHVDALSASIASLIMCAANEIRMADGSFVMIHNAWGFSIGDANAMEKQAALLRTHTAAITDTYVARTKTDRAQLTAWMDDETWMTPQEALEAGFCDAVEEPVRVAAMLPAANSRLQFRKLPAALARPNLRDARDKIAALRASV